MASLWKCVCGYLNEAIDDSCQRCSVSLAESELRKKQAQFQEAEADELRRRQRVEAEAAHQGGQSRLHDPASSPPSPNYNAEIDSIANLAQMAAVFWMITGILQVMSIIFLLVGVWNIYAASTHFTRARQIRERNPHMPRLVEGELAMTIVFLIINFFCGILGVVGCIMDMVVRERILKSRHLFEQVLQPAVAS